MEALMEIPSLIHVKPHVAMVFTSTQLIIHAKPVVP